jgi:hypothetical protein
MNEIAYKIDEPKEFSEVERQAFLELLMLQGKVQNPTIARVDRCTLLCVCKVDNAIVSIGAIKPKTNSDFNSDKADLDEMRDEFAIELGYCFTLPDFTKRGMSSSIVRMLLGKVGDKNLMASTELSFDNPMVRILEKVGFKQYGKPWKSGIHGGPLGLYLRFVK